MIAVAPVLIIAAYVGTRRLPGARRVPYDASVGRTGVCACGFVVKTYALDAFIRIDVVCILAGRVIRVVYDSANGAFVDARAAAYANIGYFYRHFLSFLFKIFTRLSKTK